MPSTSVTLLYRLKQQDDQVAWQRFSHLYSPILLGWVQRAGLNESDAADVVQEVMIALMKGVATFEYNSDRGSFRGWLKTITINKVRDRQRKKSPDAQSDSVMVQIPDARLEEIWEAEYYQEVARRALQIMKSDFEPKTWKACWETTVNERPAKEVAQELGMSEAAVFVAKSRVLKRLREELAEMLT